MRTENIRSCNNNIPDNMPNDSVRDPGCSSSILTSHLTDVKNTPVELGRNTNSGKGVQKKSLNGHGLFPKYMDRIFKNKIQKTMQKSIRYMEKTLEILERNDCKAIEIISDSFYGNHSKDTIDSWKGKLRETLAFAREFNAVHNIDCVSDVDCVAKVESPLAMEHRKYISAISRIKERHMDGKERKLAMAEAKKNYQDAKDVKYIKVNKVKWEQQTSKFGESYSVTALIHELSHASCNTVDYAYASAYKERSNDVSYHPLYLLHQGVVQESLRKGVGNDYAGMARSNADTFAHATTLLFSSLQSDAKGEDYNKFMEQQERKFSRPSPYGENINRLAELHADSVSSFYGSPEQIRAASSCDEVTEIAHPTAGGKKSVDGRPVKPLMPSFGRRKTLTLEKRKWVQDITSRSKSEKEINSEDPGKKNIKTSKNEITDDARTSDISAGRSEVPELRYQVSDTHITRAACREDSSGSSNASNWHALMHRKNFLGNNSYRYKDPTFFISRLSLINDGGLSVRDSIQALSALNDQGNNDLQTELKSMKHHVESLEMYLLALQSVLERDKSPQVADEIAKLLRRGGEEPSWHRTPEGVYREIHRVGVRQESIMIFINILDKLEKQCSAECRKKNIDKISYKVAKKYEYVGKQRAASSEGKPFDESMFRNTEGQMYTEAVKMAKKVERKTLVSVASTKLHCFGLTLSDQSERILTNDIVRDIVQFPKNLDSQKVEEQLLKKGIDAFESFDTSRYDSLIRETLSSYDTKKIIRDAIDKSRTMWRMYSNGPFSINEKKAIDIVCKKLIPKIMNTIQPSINSYVDKRSTKLTILTMQSVEGMMHDTVSKIKTDLSKKLENEIRSDMEGRVKKDIAEQVKKDIEEQVKKDIEEQVKKDIEEQVKKDIEERVIKKVTENVETEVRRSMEEPARRVTGDESRHASTSATLNSSNDRYHDVLHPMRQNMKRFTRD